MHCMLLIYFASLLHKPFSDRIGVISTREWAERSASTVTDRKATHFVLAPELISSLIWMTDAYVPATMVNEPMRTRRTLTEVRIHQLRVLSLLHVTCRYMRASVILCSSVQPFTEARVTHMQRKEPRRAPMTERRSSKMGMDSAMMKDIKQLKATQELSCLADFSQQRKTLTTRRCNG